MTRIFLCCPLRFFCETTVTPFAVQILGYIYRSFSNIDNFFAEKKSRLVILHDLERGVNDSRRSGY